MRVDVLSAEQVAVLDRLRTVPSVADFYLAGGTALALRHGHRRSIDFDFFRAEPFDGYALGGALEAVFAPALEWLPSGERTLHMRLETVSTSFFQLPYPLLEPVQPTPWGFGLASDLDVAVMMVEAVAGRGSRKDFVDLRVLCHRGIRLDELLEDFDRKYGTTRADRYHRLRALAFFEDAERQPMPDMLVPFDWAECKTFFAAEAARLLAAGLEG